MIVRVGGIGCLGTTKAHNHTQVNHLGNCPISSINQFSTALRVNKEIFRKHSTFTSFNGKDPKKIEGILKYKESCNRPLLPNDERIKNFEEEIEKFAKRGLPLTPPSMHDLNPRNARKYTEEVYPQKEPILNPLIKSQAEKQDKNEIDQLKEEVADLRAKVQQLFSMFHAAK